MEFNDSFKQTGQRAWESQAAAAPGLTGLLGPELSSSRLCSEPLTYQAFSRAPGFSVFERNHPPFLTTHVLWFTSQSHALVP